MAAISAVNAAHLKWAIKAAIPHASKDDTLPSICAVRIEVSPADKAIYIAATDRYTIGVARAEMDGDHSEIAVSVAVPDAKLLAAASTGKDPAAIEVTPHDVTLYGEYRVPASDDEDFPDWRAMLAAGLRADSVPLAADDGVDPKLLARFKDVGPATLIRVVRLPAPPRHRDAEEDAPRKAPMALVIGRHFLGAAMLSAVTDATYADDVEQPWHSRTDPVRSA